MPHIVSSVIGELACLSVDRHVSVFTDFQHATTLAYGNPMYTYLILFCDLYIDVVAILMTLADPVL